MSYAIISVGGKQYRVREGQRLLVDRLPQEDGDTFTPAVLLVGGEGETQVAPDGVVVTARVVGRQRGPKIRIGKYKQRVGYKRHTGFRAALTQIEIESIGGAKKARAAAKGTTEPEEKASKPSSGAVPAGYAEMTVADVKDAAGGWDLPALRAAFEHEQAHGGRKGALAALESAIAAKKEK
jgi:large subunit ribosomal protein L21